MTKRFWGWLALLAFAIAIKLFVVDRYMSDSPGSMLIWIPITIALILIIVCGVFVWGLIAGRHRPHD